VFEKNMPLADGPFASHNKNIHWQTDIKISCEPMPTEPNASGVKTIKKIIQARMDESRKSLSLPSVFIGIVVVIIVTFLAIIDVV
jgi:hypothetical protein